MIIEKLAKVHNRKNFDCGNQFLNDFLKKYAYQNQTRYFVGITYVAQIENKVIGYVTLSASSIKKVLLNKKKPYEDLPVLRIGRLAIDKNYQGKGIGKKLLKFAIQKALEMKNNYGCIGIVVDAKEEANSFYEKFGFKEIKILKSYYTIPMFLSLKIMSF